MIRTFAIAIAALALAAGAAYAKSCRDAKGKFIKCPAAAAAPAAPAATTTATTAPTTTGGVPHCTKGKLCGHSCISVKDLCHK